MKVTFQIEGGSPVTIECNAGDNLLELARRANVAIDAPCSGNGSCGKCRVQLIEGQLESMKSRHISDEEYEAGWRLSCCSKVQGDVTVLVPDIASAYQSRMKTADLSSPKEIEIFENCQSQLRESGISFENNYRSVVLTLSEPTLDDTMPDNERLTWAIEEALGADVLGGGQQGAGQQQGGQQTGEESGFLHQKFLCGLKPPPSGGKEWLTRRRSR